MNAMSIRAVSFKTYRSKLILFVVIFSSEGITSVYKVKMLSLKYVWELKRGYQVKTVLISPHKTYVVSAYYKHLSKTCFHREIRNISILFG